MAKRFKGNHGWQKKKTPPSTLHPPKENCCNWQRQTWNQSQCQRKAPVWTQQSLTNVFFFLCMEKIQQFTVTLVLKIEKKYIIKGSNYL